MVGVGAAFDFRGKQSTSPLLTKHGSRMAVQTDHRTTATLERYLKHNPRFALYVAAQRLGLRRFDT